MSFLGYGTLKPGKKVDVDGTGIQVPTILLLQRGHVRVNYLTYPQDGKKVIGYQ